MQYKVFEYHKYLLFSSLRLVFCADCLTIQLSYNLGFLGAEKCSYFLHYTRKADRVLSDHVFAWLVRVCRGAPTLGLPSG